MFSSLIKTTQRTKEHGYRRSAAPHMPFRDPAAAPPRPVGKEKKKKPLQQRQAEQHFEVIVCSRDKVSSTSKSVLQLRQVPGHTSGGCQGQRLEEERGNRWKVRRLLRQRAWSNSAVPQCVDFNFLGLYVWAKSPVCTHSFC